MAKQHHDIGHQKRKKNGAAYEALKEKRHERRLSREADGPGAKRPVKSPNLR